MPDAIDFKRGATVHLVPDRPGQAVAPIWTGTLAGAVRRVMAMPADERLRARIAIEEDVVPGKTLLRYADIAELHRRPDFPPENE